MASAYCVLYCKGNVTGVLVGRKTAEVPNNPGQLAFPGGRKGPAETAATAAIRELREETGVSIDLKGDEVNTGLRKFLIVRSALVNFAGYSALYIKVASLDVLTKIRWDIEANFKANAVHDREFSEMDVMTPLQARATFLKEHVADDEHRRTEWFTSIAQNANFV